VAGAAGSGTASARRARAARSRQPAGRRAEAGPGAAAPGLADEPQLAAVLMSIHREHVDAILAGTKMWEFRRRTALKVGDRVWMYATVPTGAVLGWFVIGEVVALNARHPDSRVAREGNSTPAELADYFAGLERGFGLRVARRGRLRGRVYLPSGERGPQSYRLIGTGTMDFRFLRSLKDAAGPSLEASPSTAAAFR
jgi:predicted transcriptional regulator